jgi:ferulate-5-hydroxylase
MVGFAKIAMEWLQDPLSWLFIASVVFVVLQRRRRGNVAPFPPGPKPLPIVGNMSMMDQLTHRGLAALAKEYGGLLHIRLGKLHTFAVSTPEYAREVLQVQDGAFSNRPATIAIAYLTYDRADMAFAHYGPFWRQMRKLCVMKLFSRRRPETWLAVRDESAALVRAVARRSGQSVDLGELIFKLTKNVIFRAAFGAGAVAADAEEGDGAGKQDEFIAILQEFSKLFGAFNIGDFIPWLSWADPQGINVRLRPRATPSTSSSTRSSTSTWRGARIPMMPMPTWWTTCSRSSRRRSRRRAPPATAWTTCRTRSASPATTSRPSSWT